MEIQNAPTLMPKQWEAFNGDRFICEEFLKLKEKFNIKNAIETGTCLGSTTLFLAQNFKEVYTIEINNEYRDIALKRFTKNDNIHSYLGSSEELIKEAIKYCNNDTIIFLDAHWGESYCPLQDELKAIAESEVKPIIAIHDFLVPHIPERGYDSIHGQPFSFEWIKPALDNIYGENRYDHYYNEEATEINRGIIYITPKL